MSGTTIENKLRGRKKEKEKRELKKNMKREVNRQKKKNKTENMKKMIFQKIKKVNKKKRYSLNVLIQFFLFPSSSFIFFSYISEF